MTAIEQKQVEMLRALGPVGRLEAACGLYEFAREFLTLNLRAEHADWTEEQLQQTVRRRMSGTGVPVP